MHKAQSYILNMTKSAVIKRVRGTPTRGVLCSEPLPCVMEESGPAVLDHPLPSFVSCSCAAAAQEETRKTTQGNQQLFTSCTS